MLKPKTYYIDYAQENQVQARAKSGAYIDKDFHPFLYVEAGKEAELAIRLAESRNMLYKTETVKMRTFWQNVPLNLVKIYTKSPIQVKQLAEELERRTDPNTKKTRPQKATIFASDINYLLNYLIHQKHKIYEDIQTLRGVCIDVELVNEGTHVPRAGEGTIIIGGADQYDIARNLYRDCYRSEIVIGHNLSLDYQEPIIIKHKDQIKIIPIGKFVEQAGEKPEEYEACAVDWTTGKTKWYPITRTYKHKSPDTLIEIETEDGRKIRVTPYHSLFTLKNGEIISIPTDRLEIGDHIVVPTRLPETAISKSTTPEKAELLGYYTAEGTKGTWSPIIVNKDPKLIAHAEALVKSIGLSPYTYKYKNGMIHLHIGGKRAKDMIKASKCHDPDGQKRIPPEIFTATRRAKLAYLRGYTRGDGCEYKKKYGTRITHKIIWQTVSKNLANDLAYLLLTLGCNPTIHTRKPKENHKINGQAINQQLQYTITIEKREDLEKLDPILEKTKITNSPYRRSSPPNIIPTKESRLKEWWHQTPIKKNGNTHRLLEHNKRAGRQWLKKIIEKYNLAPETLPHAAKLFYNGDIGFSRITRIRRVKPTTEYVYDISTPNAENFVAGTGGIIAHNSFDWEHISARISEAGKFTTHRKNYSSFMRGAEIAYPRTCFFDTIFAAGIAIPRIASRQLEMLCLNT